MSTEDRTCEYRTYVTWHPITYDIEHHPGGAVVVGSNGWVHQRVDAERLWVVPMYCPRATAKDYRRACLSVGAWLGGVRL